MSAETTTWLNTNTLIGMTDVRGNAWHYRAEEQGNESNHYPGAIPIEDIRRRLFDWQGVPRRVAVEKPADLETATHFGEDGSPMRWVVETNRQAITASDNEDTLGLFKDGYAGHQYDEWLLEEVAELLVGNPLVASSAGLLRNRGLAWVEVSVPENRTVCGVEFRPNLVAATSFDGSLSTTYKRTIGATVCHAKDTLVIDGDWRGLVQDHPSFTQSLRTPGREVTVWGLPFAEKVSNDHRYWVRERRRTLAPVARHRLGVTSSSFGEDREATWVYAHELSPVKHEIGTPINTTVRPVPEIVSSLDTAWILGYWWGNGHINLNQGSITLSIPDTKPEVLQRARGYVEGRGHATQKPGCVQFTWTNRRLAELLNEWKHEGWSQKAPPVWAEEAPLDWQLELAKGYFEADGNTGDTKPGLIIVSVSLDGLLGLRRILTRLGVPSSIRKGSSPALRSVIQGREVSAQEQYSIRFISDLFGYETTHARTLHPYIEDGWLWSRVDTVNPWEGDVYPITTDTHQYVTPFGLSHNCDNTLSAALGERGSPTLKFKHSKNSGYRRAEARHALAIIDATGAGFEHTVRRLTGARVSDLQFREVLNVLVPIGDDASKQAKTMGTNKRNALTTMWVSDERVAPWTGTAFGVVQAFNTWEQHERPTRGGTQRAERNMLNALNGNVDKFDAEVVAALHGLQLV